VPRPTALNLSRLAETLSDLDAEAVRATRQVNVTNPELLRAAPLVPLTTRYGRLDLLDIDHTAGAPSSFEELRERALVVDLDGIAIPVAGLDDLIRMKRAAGRPHDLQDIGALTRTEEELLEESREAT
jgi:hypothetical protein